MKRPKLLCLLVYAFFISIISLSCKKDPIPKSDYIVFGTFYGECMGEQCIEIFKMQGDKLYEDINDKYPNSNAAYNGDFVKLSDDKYELVKDIRNKIPDSLYHETDHVIGQPDAGDWGGIYFEINKNGKTYYWLIDTQKGNLPAYLQVFSYDIMQAAGKLR